MGPAAAAPADPLGDNSYARAMLEDQDAQRQALAQAIDDLGRNAPRSPAALAEDLAAQALLQYAQSHRMQGLAGDAAGGGGVAGAPPFDQNGDLVSQFAAMLQPDAIRGGWGG